MSGLRASRLLKIRSSRSHSQRRKPRNKGLWGTFVPTQRRDLLKPLRLSLERTKGRVSPHTQRKARFSRIRSRFMHKTLRSVAKITKRFAKGRRKRASSAAVAKLKANHLNRFFLIRLYFRATATLPLRRLTRSIKGLREFVEGKVKKPAFLNHPAGLSSIRFRRRKVKSINIRQTALARVLRSLPPHLTKQKTQTPLRPLFAPHQAIKKSQAKRQISTSHPLPLQNWTRAYGAFWFPRKNYRTKMALWGFRPLNTSHEAGTHSLSHDLPQFKWRPGYPTLLRRYRAVFSAALKLSFFRQKQMTRFVTHLHKVRGLRS